MLFAVTISDFNAVSGFVIVALPVNRNRRGIVVTKRALDIKFMDHLLREQCFQIADAAVVDRIQGICQSVIKVLFRGNTRQDNIQNSRG